MPHTGVMHHTFECFPVDPINAWFDPYWYTTPKPPGKVSKAQPEVIRRMRGWVIQAKSV